MASLNTPLSVRLSEKDTAFLAGLKIDDAVTASDKVRALIASARRQAEASGVLTGGVAAGHEQVAGATRRVRALERSIDEHSDVAAGLMAMAEEFLALALNAPQGVGPDLKAALTQYEARLVDCAARLSEHLLRWAVTPEAPAYDPRVVSRRVARMADIMQLVVSVSAGRTRED